jgi:TatA/E family protein of Tat protein translocase
MGLDNPLHIAFLLVVLLMVFGAKRLPEMGKSLGHGLRGFKDAINPDATPHAALGVGDSAQPESLAPAILVQPAEQVAVPQTDHTERAAA